MESNREVMETWFRRVWAELDVAAIDEMFVSDGEARGLGANVLIGPEGFKTFHAALCSQLSDIKISIDHSIESGNWLSTICTLRAISNTTKEMVEMTGSVEVRIEGGKLREAYNHWDFLGLFTQLGMFPSGSFERSLGGEKSI